MSSDDPEAHKMCDENFIMDSDVSNLKSFQTIVYQIMRIESMSNYI